MLLSGFGDSSSELTNTESNNVYILCRSRVATLLRVLNVATGVGGKAWVKKPRIRENSERHHTPSRQELHPLVCSFRIRPRSAKHLTN